MLPSPTQLAQTPRFQVKREAILGAAALRFNEQGVKGATLSGIAASVGLATNSVTYYYRRKEDLATACFLRSIAAFESLAAKAAHEQRGVAARVQAFVLEHVGVPRYQRESAASCAASRALPTGTQRRWLCAARITKSSQAVWRRSTRWRRCSISGLKMPWRENSWRGFFFTHSHDPISSVSGRNVCCGRARARW